MGMRAALYLRVSTSRQAEKDLSIPDQRRQLTDYCASRGYEVTAEYTEPGKSATDDKRPKLQQMMSDAKGTDKPFDVIIVHSFSRFFRDAYQFEFHRRVLAKNGVEIVSMTQELSNDPMGEMVRQILNLFDEYQSKENGKHVLRAMKENARQGFWNGSQPPYGYQAVPVEVRADTVKKKLEIEPREAEVVRLVFDMHRQGDGIRVIASNLNNKGYRYRKGHLFESSRVHQILTRTAYAGYHHFNKTENKTGRKKDRTEWIEFQTPIIIDPKDFKQTQLRLDKRRPAQTPSRVSNGPTLLVGLAKCGSCGGGMTIRTGKGGRYRYYACNARISKGKTGCEGRSIPMGYLDDLVVSQFESRILQPDRLESILQKLIERTKNKNTTLLTDAKELRKELRQTNEKIDRLYGALAEGTIQDNDAFRRNLSKFEQMSDELIRRISSLDRQRSIPNDIVTKASTAAFAQAMHSKLHDPDGAFRKNYLRLFIERIDVHDDEIRITGSKSSLVQGLVQAQTTGAKVPNYDVGWWAR